MPSDEDRQSTDGSWQYCDPTSTNYTAESDRECLSYLGNLHNIKAIRPMFSILSVARTIKLRVSYRHNNLQAIMKVRSPGPPRARALPVSVLVASHPPVPLPVPVAVLVLVAGAVGLSTGGGGVWEKGSIDRTIDQLLWTLAPKALIIFLSIKNCQIFFSPNIWQMMTFLNPLDALIPIITFSFSPIFGSGSPPRPGGQSR